MVLLGASKSGSRSPDRLLAGSRRNLTYLTETAQQALTKRREVVVTKKMVSS